MTIKVLPLPVWLLSDIGLAFINANSAAKPVPGRFNRPGIYLDGRCCWFEAHGRAWWYSPQQFRFELSLLEVQDLNARQVQALKAVVGQRLATKKQIELHHMCLYAAQSRNSEIEHLRRLLVLKPGNTKFKPEKP